MQTRLRICRIIPQSEMDSLTLLPRFYLVVCGGIQKFERLDDLKRVALIRFNRSRL